MAVAARDGRTETFPLCSLRSHGIMPFRLAVPLGDELGDGLEPGQVRARAGLPGGVPFAIPGFWGEPVPSSE